MADVNIPPAGDPFYAAGIRRSSTRHHRCDHEFLGILEEDYGIRHFALRSAFMGVPLASKKEAMALCEWALRAAGSDPEAAGDALRAWAKKNRCGDWSPAFDPACAGCGRKDGDLHPVPDDHPMFFEGDELCESCAGNTGIL